MVVRLGRNAERTKWHDEVEIDWDGHACAHVAPAMAKHQPYHYRGGRELLIDFTISGAARVGVAIIRVTAACTGMVTIQGTSATTVAIIS
jgi:hypothetical protein